MPHGHAVHRLAAAVLAVALGAVAWQPGGGTAGAEDAPAIELRVWQHLEDARDLYVSARAPDGLWESLGIIPLPLDGGPIGSYRYGDITLAVPLGGGAPAATVELWLWQHVNTERLYISARLVPGSWETLGTVPVAPDDGFHAHRALRFGDVELPAGPSLGAGSSLREDGVVSLAGRPGSHGYRDGAGDEALFGGHSIGVAVDRDGSVVVADYGNHAIRRVLPDGTVTTVAGGNGSGSRDGPAEVARFEGPSDVAIDPEGAIFVAECPAHRIRKIDSDGTVTTVTGFHHPEDRGWRVRDGRAADAVLHWPCGLEFSPTGDLYILEQIRIRRLSPSGRVTTFAGGRGQFYRDGPRAEAQFGSLQDIDVDAGGNVYVIDASRYVPGRPGLHYAVRRIDTSGIVSTLFRSGPPWDGGVLAEVTGLAVTPGGEVYVGNAGRHQIVRVDGRESLVPVAGTGEQGFLDGPRDRALLGMPGAIDIAEDGTIVVVDQGNGVVRVVSPDADGGFSGVDAAVIREIPRLERVRISRVDGAWGRLRSPRQMALDRDGNIIVADALHDAIARVSPEGAVSTAAGGAGEGSRDGPRGQAQFSGPRGVAVDAGGAIFVADTGNGLIRRIAPDGSVTTVAGREQPLSRPESLAFDLGGNLLIAESGTRNILRLSPAGELSILVTEGVRPGGLAAGAEGTTYYTASGGGGSFIRTVDAAGIVSAVFSDRSGRQVGIFSDLQGGIAVAPDGTLYVTDLTFGRVVRITPDGDIAIVVDRQSVHGFGRFRPEAVLLTADGDLLVSDSSRGAIWRVAFGGGEQ